MTTMNRAIPVAIAIIRYCCVFHDNVIRDPRKKWNLQAALIGYIAFSVGLNLLIFIDNPEAFQRFQVCMGREEAYEYNLDDFYNGKFQGAANNVPLAKRFAFWLIAFYI